MNKTQAKFIANIFHWAWSVGLDVTLTSRSYGNFPTKEFLSPRVTREDWPILRFSKDSYSREFTFDSIDRLCVEAKYVMERIGADILCKPFEEYL